MSLSYHVFLLLIYFKGVVVAKKIKKRGFHWLIVARAQIVGPNIIYLIYLKMLQPKKSKVTDCSSNQKRAYKTDGIIFRNASPP